MQAIINFYTVEESLFADVEDILHDIDEILTKSTDKVFLSEIEHIHFDL